MKILILCNIILPEIAKELGTGASATGGWIIGITEGLLKTENNELCVVFPQTVRPEWCEGNTGRYAYCGFPEDFSSPLQLREGRTDKFAEILRREEPDIVHIFGTEWLYSYEMMQACIREGYRDRTVVSIQGLVSGIAGDCFKADLPDAVCRAQSFRDFIKHDSILAQQEEYRQRGVYEQKTLAGAKHVIGRTDWDKAAAKRINPDVQYHYCQETLRPEFYGKAWCYKDCEKHSLFVSQGYYPLKGFHKMLEAMPLILKEYPDAVLYVTGSDPLAAGFKASLHQTYYQKYIGRMIRRYGLREHVRFLGTLNAEQMAERDRLTHVFVCPSSIENSSNSVGEALLVGTPVCAADVGGMRSIMSHEKEGLLYPFADVEALAESVKRIFAMGEEADALSAREKARAAVQYDPAENTEDLVKIYREMAGENI